KIHIVTAAVTSAQNIVKCANKAGLNVMDIVLEPLASAEACLAEDERDLGVCLIDIGGGTTDVAVYSAGAIKHTSVRVLGGAHVSPRTPPPTPRGRSSTPRCSVWGAPTSPTTSRWACAPRSTRPSGSRRNSAW